MWKIKSLVLILCKKDVDPRKPLKELQLGPINAMRDSFVSGTGWATHRLPQRQASVCLSVTSRPLRLCLISSCRRIEIDPVRTIHI
ncbi:hypothetical protein NQZ68_001103 [Dissostichus eleginoides]|nr:hypothetical protein NQZ68_001103 [Dissostichus eleginoides]